MTSIPRPNPEKVRPMKYQTRSASMLEPRDEFESHGTTVTVLWPKEPAQDLFGRPMFRFWCKRADTGAEGWMTFGPEGIVLIPSDGSE